MMPGMGKMNPKQMNVMMKRLGINVEEIENVEEVVIRTPTKDYVFKNAEVTIMKTPQGATYQLAGSPTIVSKTGGAKPEAKKTKEDANTGVAGKIEDVVLEVSDDDVALVSSQTGVDAKKARRALEDAKGDIAEAILALSS